MAVSASKSTEPGEGRSPVKGAVDPSSLKGKIPDSKRVFPYDPTSHPSSKYALQPEMRPEDYDAGTDAPPFDMARRKLHTLLLGLCLGCVLLGIALTIGLVVGRGNAQQYGGVPSNDTRGSSDRIRSS